MTTRTFSFVISRRVLPSLAPPAPPIRSCLATGAVAPLSWSLTLMTLMTTRAQVLTTTPVFFNTTQSLFSLQLPKLATDRGSAAPMGKIFFARCARVFRGLGPENLVSVPSGGRPGSENLVSGVQKASRKIIFDQDL